MSRILLTGVLATLTAVCIYTAYVSGKNQDRQSAWFFYAFSLLFAVPLLAVIINMLAQRNAAFRSLDEKLSGPKKQEAVRFVPHWFVMSMISVFGILAVVNVVGIILKAVK